MGFVCRWRLFFRADPAELEKYEDDEHDVFVVKHPELVTSTKVKMDGKVNRPYPCKYWSSLMYINCDEQETAPDDVNEAPAGDLHEFKWAENMGSLPATWNNMELYDIYQPNAALYRWRPLVKRIRGSTICGRMRAVLEETRRSV